MHGNLRKKIRAINDGNFQRETSKREPCESGLPGGDSSVTRGIGHCRIGLVYRPRYIFFWVDDEKEEGKKKFRMEGLKVRYLRKILAVQRSLPSSAASHVV